MFLAVLLFSSLSMQSEVLTVRFFPTVTRENEPLVVTATLNNIRLKPQKYRVTLYVDGEQVATAESLLEPAATQSFTYTRASPKTGEALRIYVEAVNLDTGEKYREYFNIPQSPPELWISFSAFSSFATSMTSTTSTTSLATITYYLNTMGIAAQETIGQPTINTGIIVSVILILLLVFIELTDPAYGKIGRKLAALRGRYGTLSASLLLIFTGIVLTKVVMIIAA
ncbi:MAG: hypothetical protein RMK50_04665 [Nitrososphaerota archaeon]|nr:hypothetical protein [Candidatus Bathyarchaeota archaeon]MDW8194092.1 hypothetical protein [Nitrososphaerota archaeon]